LRVLGFFSRIEAAALLLVTETELHASLLKVLVNDYYQDSTRAAALRTLADLSYSPTNGTIILSYPGMLDAMMEFVYVNDYRIRRSAARAIQNLMFCATETELDKNFEIIVSGLISLTKYEEKVRQHAMNAILNLMAADTIKIALVEFNNGAVVARMTAIVASPHEYTDRERFDALKTIQHLVLIETVEAIGDQTNLLDVITSSSIKDVSEEVKELASKTLQCLSSKIYHPMTCYECLLGAILRLGPECDMVPTLLRDHSSILSNRKTMSEHPSLIELLSQIAKPNSRASTKAKECAIDALVNLARLSYS